MSDDLIGPEAAYYEHLRADRQRGETQRAEVLAEAERRFMLDPVFHARAVLAAQMAGDQAGPRQVAAVALVIAERDPRTGQASPAVPVARVRALVALLFPSEMTPHAKRLIERVCDEYEQGVSVSQPGSVGGS